MSELTITERTTCRSCGTILPKENLLSLGVQHIVDFLVDGEEGRGQAPLELVLCSACQLLQLRHTVNADILYRKFWYRSGINEQMRSALRDIVVQAENRVHLKAGDYVCDIGSNDGTMLSYYDKDIRKVGFEPATELGIEASQKVKGKFVLDYFNAAAALKASGDKKYKVVTAIAMFYDLEHPAQFVKDIREVLHDDGLFIVQMNYLPLMMQILSFDNIGHEHLCYYSLTALKGLFDQFGLKIVEVDLNGVNGGSIRIYARKALKEKDWQLDPEVDVLLEEEKQHLTPTTYKAFAERVQTQGRQLKEFLYNLKEKGKTVYVYGASTRGSTLLQTIMEGSDAREVLAGAAERDPNKWGRKMAGLNLVIVPEDTARRVADFMLILCYHFWESISKRERDWMMKGGKFILPVPYPRVVSLEDANGTLTLVAKELKKEMEELGEKRTLEEGLRR